MQIMTILFEAGKQLAMKLPSGYPLIGTYTIGQHKGSDLLEYLYF